MLSSPCLMGLPVNGSTQFVSSFPSRPLDSPGLAPTIYVCALVQGHWLRLSGNGLTEVARTSTRAHHKPVQLYGMLNRRKQSQAGVTTHEVT